MNKSVAIIIIILAAVVILGIRSHLGRKTTFAGTEDKVVNFKDNDSEMNAAIQRARTTFGEFTSRWKNVKNDGYSLKFAVPTKSGGREHIWFNPISIDGDKIIGRCANDPDNVPGLKVGDMRELSQSDLSDWMLLIGTKCYGGYTTRIIANKDPSQKPPFEFADF